MLGDESKKPREAEHLTFRVVGLYQPVAVEQCCLAGIEHYLVLLVVHFRHKPKGHTPSPKLFGIAATTAHVGQVVARVGVPQATALWVEDTVEAGYEHVGWDAGQQRLVDLGQYL